MKHSITTLNTKKMFAESLRKLALSKPFLKITVSNIVEDCKVNRKTFYYHFNDIYDLLKWTLEQDAISVVKQFDLIAEYEEAVNFVMNYVEENSVFLKNISHSIANSELEKFLYTDFLEITSSVINEAEKMLELSVPDDYKKFMCSFYTQAISGVLVEWIDNHPNADREKTVSYISAIFRSTIPAALQEGAKLKK